MEREKYGGVGRKDGCEGSKRKFVYVRRFVAGKDKDCGAC